jgi:hypothetical protein
LRRDYQFKFAFFFSPQPLIFCAAGLHELRHTVYYEGACAPALAMPRPHKFVQFGGRFEF